MSCLPIALNVSGHPCLVVGGGAVAARKVDMLRQFAADITVVAPELHPPLQRLVAEGAIRHIAARFEPGHLRRPRLVIAATGERAVNRTVAELAQSAGIPVNVVDDPELCTFITPSLLNRDPLFIAVSSGGVSPVLVRLLRARLETLIPAGYGRLARLLADFRESIRQRYPDAGDRRRFLESILQGRVESLVLSGRDEAAARMLEAHLRDADFPVERRGEVYLVGGGPGDPDLLTFKALRLMQQADVVLYDRLVAKSLLELVRRDAERIYVGKRRDQHTIPQQEINQLLVDLARQGKRVLRLKGGDPFIFGRGGEEIESLAAAGVSWQIVPGITAASGCASYAGIPLTHREHAQSCLLLTGHLKDNRLDLNWQSLLQPRQTVVIYMGTHGLGVLCGELLSRGMAPDLPAAIVEQGTTERQRVHISDVQGLPALVERAHIKPPSLIILGTVVRLHGRLAWYRPG